MADNEVSLPHADLAGVREKIGAGGAAKYHQSAAASGKMFARERIAMLVDDGSFARTASSPTPWPTGSRPTA